MSKCQSTKTHKLIYVIIMLTKDTAICIRAVDYSETSQIVTFFARETGKVSAIAKGSKRPKSAFDGPIEVLSFGQIVFSDSSRQKLATLTEFQQQRIFAQMWSDLFILNCCLLATELIDKMTDDYDPHPELFDSFLQFLKDTNEHSPLLRGQACPCGSRGSDIEHRDVLSLLILFQLSLLKEVGLMPVLNVCANCKTQYAVRNTQHEVYFSSSANGLICRDCEASFPDRIRLTSEAAACLADLKRIGHSGQKTMNEIERVLFGYFTEILGYRLKMAKFLWKIPQSNIEYGNQ